MVRTILAPVNLPSASFTSKLSIPSIGILIHLVRHGWPFPSLRLLHQEKKRQHNQKHPSQEPEYIVVRQHGGLPLHHAPKSAVCLVVGSDGVRASRHECLAQSGQCRLSLRTGLVDVTSQNVDVCLHAAELEGFDS